MPQRENYDLRIWQEFGLTSDHWEHWLKVRSLDGFDPDTRRRVEMAQAEARRRVNEAGARRAQRAKRLRTDVRHLAIVALVGCVGCLLARIPVSPAVLVVVAIAAGIVIAVSAESS